MITERQFLEEYALACHAAVAATKKWIDTSDPADKNSLYTALSKRDTLADLLRRYFGTSEKVLQHVLDEANKANYHL